jgi:hypothetical protein
MEQAAWVLIRLVWGTPVKVGMRKTTGPSLPGENDTLGPSRWTRSERSFLSLPRRFACRSFLIDQSSISPHTRASLSILPTMLTRLWSSRPPTYPINLPSLTFATYHIRRLATAIISRPQFTSSIIYGSVIG